MLTQISKLEVKIENKVYSFICDQDSPLNQLKEALFQFQKYVGQVEDHVKAQIDAQKVVSDAPVPDQSKPEDEHSKIESIL